MNSTLFDSDPKPADGWSPARLAYGFYITAATGAVIGQTWVALAHVPFPAGWSPGLRVVAVMPFAAVLELLAMVLAAMGDQRQRLGERALGFRAFSALVAILAVSIIVVGHWGHPYTVAAFGTLSASAYLLWLLHAAARRRDALRAAGLLDRVAPAYGWRWLRQPLLTARARELAVAQGMDLGRSLVRAQRAREAERVEAIAARRRRRIARAVRQVVRSQQRNRRDAKLAALSLDLDRIAGDLQAAADYDWWRGELSTRLGLAGASQPAEKPATAGPPAVEAEPAQPKPVRPARRDSKKATTADRVARMIGRKPGISKAEVAVKLGVSERTVQRAWPDPSPNSRDGHGVPEMAEVIP